MSFRMFCGNSDASSPDSSPLVFEDWNSAMRVRDFATALSRHVSLTSVAYLDGILSTIYGHLVRGVVLSKEIAVQDGNQLDSVKWVILAKWNYLHNDAYSPGGKQLTGNKSFRFPAYLNTDAFLAHRSQLARMNGYSPIGNQLAYEDWDNAKRIGKCTALLGHVGLTRATYPPEGSISPIHLVRGVVLSKEIAVQYGDLKNGMSGIDDKHSAKEHGATHGNRRNEGEAPPHEGDQLPHASLAHSRREAGQITLFVKPPNAHIIQLIIDRNGSVKDLKQLIETASATPVSSQVLTWKGKC